MVGTMTAIAAPSDTTTTPHVNGSGTIVSVSWSPTPIQAIPIPSNGATIKLEAKGLLQIFYNGKPIVVGNNDIPITNPPIYAKFNGILQTPIVISYNGVTTNLMPTPNMWKLELLFTSPPYSGTSVTLGIVGPLIIT